ncbi:hypothetical protein GPECTOR_239g572 [Gonium pectorale]|uniref:Uncharacterized protein n=1 Tax=Gonium pectorale TaxID=33097 RepID=A0A150FWE9_GONPE|nr:hypothetical protein GPECTOR_239g572 [Gonium pectorale]|eukprot:KXZ41942.1 hypothetical protein GPECTOR_239g572 [Gonium pectorale]
MAYPLPLEPPFGTPRVSSDASGLFPAPAGALRLDRDGLAAAVAFLEAHPGNVYGRALLMRFAGRQVGRAALAPPATACAGRRAPPRGCRTCCCSWRCRREGGMQEGGRAGG